MNNMAMTADGVWQTIKDTKTSMKEEWGFDQV